MVITPAASAAPPPFTSPLRARTVTPLANVVASSPTIVVGNMPSGPRTSFHVQEVLRGSATGSTLNVALPPGSWPVIGSLETVVLFIDGLGVPRWVGQAMSPRGNRGQSLDDAVIHVQGVSNLGISWDLAAPGILSLAQLKDFLATGRLDQTIDVTLGFRDVPTGAPSSRHFTVRAQGVASPKPTVSVTGLSLACLGVDEVAIPDPPGSLVVRMGDTCRSSTRSIELGGRFVGLDTSSGHLLARVEPTRPALTEREFEMFARDPSIVDVQPIVSVGAVVMPDEEKPSWKSWTWRLADRALVDPSGKVHPRAQPAVAAGPGAPLAPLDFGDASLFIDGLVSDSGALLTDDPWSAFRAVLRSRGACTLVRPGQSDARCRLDPQPPVFVRR